MPTVFLAEDNAGDIELFRLAMQDACIDCDLVVFQDGHEIIDHVRRSASAVPASVPDLIVLDLNLPKSSGLEVLQVIRHAPAFAKVPVAILSSSSSGRERTQLAAFQIREFIVKPADLDEYLQIGKIVNNLLEESKAQRAFEA